MPMPPSPAGAGAPRVAIVSDGSAVPTGTDLNEALRDQAELLNDLTRVRAEPVVLHADNTTALAASIRALPANVGAVMLTHMDSTRAREVAAESRERGARPLLTEDDVTAISLAGVTLSTLAKAGRRARGHRVVLAGARELPGLIALLMAGGVDDITTWNSPDAATFPLATIAAGADLVIDLAGALPSRPGGSLDGMTVITRDDVDEAPHVAAGLLVAAASTPGLTLDVEIFHACAQVLRATSPSERHTRPLSGAELTRRIADAATYAFHTRLSR
ncbi:hypothetical protein SAMN05421504_104533 [Amycolatopsis xylanica]|uniref:Uncharacterized protein n=1 Tax=Amycolatopsis xylanica TaxID=589385 RepID=A0A1H3H5W1_9PSEU|nr:hypothetical protein [Amycolatopsis xylanica]SDY10963.1 hypothetical protein SAMN05421504_104533 [Amycolatopsis xylanica]